MIKKWFKTMSKVPVLDTPLDLEDAGLMGNILKALRESDSRLYFQKQEVSKGVDYHVFLLGEYLATLRVREVITPTLTLVSRQYKIKASFTLVEKKVKVVSSTTLSGVDWETTHYEIADNGLAYLKTFLDHCINAMQENTKDDFFRGPPPIYRKY